MEYLIIHKFMLDELKLSNTELLVFALIYSFSSKQGGCFCGSREYLAGAINACTRSVTSALKSLTERGLVIKHGHSGPSGFAYVVADAYKNRHTVNLGGGGVQDLHPVQSATFASEEGKACTPGVKDDVKNGEKLAPNNKDNKENKKVYNNYISNEMNKKYKGYKYSELPESVRRNMEEKAIAEIEKRREEQRRADYANEVFARALTRTYGESAKSWIEELYKNDFKSTYTYSVKGFSDEK